MPASIKVVITESSSAIAHDSEDKPASLSKMSIECEDKDLNSAGLQKELPSLHSNSYKGFPGEPQSQNRGSESKDGQL